MNRDEPTIFIIDDEIEMRNSLCWLMESLHYKVKTFENIIDFLKNMPLKQIGCLLLDVCMPKMNGLELLEILHSLKNPIPVIIITGHGDIPTAVKAMKLGAVDFILKPFSDQQIIEAIHKALKQFSFDSNGISDNTNKINFSTLTHREKEILSLIVEGKLNKQIAHTLNIGISTVELHRSRMMKKMQAKNIAELVKKHTLLGA